MGIGFRELLILLLIVLIVFGAKRLRTIGSDLGSAVKSFRKGMSEDDETPSAQLGHDQSATPDNGKSQQNRNTAD